MGWTNSTNVGLFCYFAQYLEYKKFNVQVGSWGSVAPTPKKLGGHVPHCPHGSYATVGAVVPVANQSVGKMSSCPPPPPKRNIGRQTYRFAPPKKMTALSMIWVEDNISASHAW